MNKDYGFSKNAKIVLSINKDQQFYSFVIKLYKEEERSGIFLRKDARFCLLTKEVTPTTNLHKLRR